MISEITFSNNYSSFWRSIAPTLDIFVRRVNKTLYNRWGVPIGSQTPPHRRAYINELSFALFKHLSKNKIKQISEFDTTKNLNKISDSVYNYVTRFNSHHKELNRNLSRYEHIDILKQTNRLLDFFHKRKDILINPEFTGCGIIDSCRGDVLVSPTLYEIKAGDRQFRSIDFKQLLTYCSLNFASKQFIINKIGIFNPRTGIFYEDDLVDICLEIGGTHPFDFLSLIIQAVAS